MSHLRKVVAAVGFSTALVAACGVDRQVVGVLPAPVEGGTPSFTTADAAPDPERAFTEYCPTAGCPAPFTTCTDSHFPCDVDLSRDPANCGSCGFRCEGSGAAKFDCISGTCALRCKNEPGAWTRDCNGVIDDDCEVRLGSNENCNGCGDRCPDPANPCIFDDEVGKGQCGCGPDRLYCGRNCIDPKTNDKNCGGCGIVCPPNVDGGTLKPNTYLGCFDEECGHVKCSEDYADCDKDKDNGCETWLLSPSDCGACNHACDPGQTCVKNSKGTIKCICPPGQTLCGGTCTDLATDPDNCGACGVRCVTTSTVGNSVGICVYGSCTLSCAQGWGDCNGDPRDGCEGNLSSDPRNCGACGNACDVLAGQPCIASRCAVHPCGEGEEAR